MSKEHHYKCELIWTGNKGSGTSDYKSYDRNFTVNINNKKPLEGSSDAAFHGDVTKYNPEDLFLISLSSCHMLWYLHLCSDKGITVISYEDNPSGIMIESDKGGGHFTEVMLHPAVVITDGSQIIKAMELHDLANKKCFIANSCNFKIQHSAKCIAE